MIGRDGNVPGWLLRAWARDMRPARGLTPGEGHLLIVLATYSNQECVAWPSLATLAVDLGLKPKEDGRPPSQLSRSLGELQKLDLVWSKSGGHGRPAIRELLCNPEKPVEPRATRYPRQPRLEEVLEVLRRGPGFIIVELDVNGVLASFPEPRHDHVRAAHVATSCAHEGALGGNPFASHHVARALTRQPPGEPGAKRAQPSALPLAAPAVSLPVSRAQPPGEPGQKGEKKRHVSPQQSDQEGSGDDSRLTGSLILPSQRDEEDELPRYSREDVDRIAREVGYPLNGRDEEIVA